MSASILPTAILALPLAAALSFGSAPKPCAAPAGVSAATLLAQAEVARKLAGTENVALDASGGCIDISVRTPGTARLVELVLRGMEVPSGAVRFQVDSSAIPAGGSRRT